MTPKKEPKGAPPETVKLFDNLLATNPKIERKGDNNPYSAVNGNMFVVLLEHGMGLRLPADEREQFVRKYKTTLFKAYGIVMKEYVAVPDGLLAKTKELKKHLDSSFEYAKTLKPKPTTRKK
jgi:hypothetical protein